MLKNTGRLQLLDTIRGITIISMIIYHACWDLVYFGLWITEEQLYSRSGYIWQQSICYTFILLSGFCFSFGKKHIKRGLLALGGGILITIITLIVLPDERDVFGVLWLIGSSILVMTLLDKIQINSVKAYLIGFIISLLCFILLRNVNQGFIGFEGINLFELPSKLYSGYAMTFLGFKDPEFFSSDYFSFLPWFFLFTTGYYLNKLLINKLKDKAFMQISIKPLSFIGRHSLFIYMIHQVVIYGLLSVIYQFLG